MYDIQYCFICRPSDSTMSKDAGIEPRTHRSEKTFPRNASSGKNFRGHLGRQRNNIAFFFKHICKWNVFILYSYLNINVRIVAIDCANIQYIICDWVEGATPVYELSGLWSDVAFWSRLRLCRELCGAEGKGGGGLNSLHFSYMWVHVCSIPRLNNQLWPIRLIIQLVSL